MNALREEVLKDTKRTMSHTETTIAEQIEKITDDVKKLGELAGANAKRKLVHAREQGKELYGRAKTQSRLTVKRRPLTSLTAAAGLGALASGVGLMLLRRSNNGSNGSDET